MGLFLAAKHAQTRQVCLVFVCKLYASLRFGGVKKEEAVIQPSSKYLQDVHGCSLFELKHNFAYFILYYLHIYITFYMFFMNMLGED